MKYFLNSNKNFYKANEKKYINMYELSCLKIKIIENVVKILYKHIKIASKLSDNPTIPLQENMQRQEIVSSQTYIHVCSQPHRCGNNCNSNYSLTDGRIHTVCSSILERTIVLIYTTTTQWDL